MIKKTCGVMAASVLLALASCNDENPWVGEAGRGAIQLTLNADGKVKDAIPQTRAHDDPLFDLPESEHFSIRLVKEDGSFSKEYPSVADFRKEESFPTGTYTLTALYGNSQEMGFGTPAFEGSTKVTVLEGETSRAQITALVAHSLISIEYTDAFKSYLHDYSTEIHTENHGYLAVPADNEDVAFVVPGNVSLSVEFTNPQGQSVKIQPAEFEAEAAHHYHITLDVNGGEVGVAQLVIKFDDSLTEEDVVIDLTEELFTSPAPSVRPVGFENGETLEFLAGEAPEGQLRFNVISHGGMKDITLTLSGTLADGKTYVPSFGNEVNLLSGVTDLEGQLAALGIDCKGVFRNPDKMAIIDFSNLPKNVAPGSYEISLLAKDTYSRVSEAVSFKFTAVAPTIEAEGLVAIAGVNVGTVSVTYNGSNPSDDISFMAQNRMGSWVKAAVENVLESQKSRALPTNTYIFTIKLPDTDHNPMSVKVYLRGEEKQTVSLPVEMPDYSVASDALARKVMIKVEGSSEQIAPLTENLNFFQDGKIIQESRIVRDPESGIVTISGFEPNTSYTLQTSFGNKSESGTKEMTFTTENAGEIPNGDFSSYVASSVNKSSIQDGGDYQYSVVLGYASGKNTTSISINVPTGGWADTNQKTAYAGTSPMNTWFYVPCVFTDGNGSVTVRSVAYDYSGTMPDKYTAPTLGKKYSQNLPKKLADKAAGEFFLGSYSYTGTTSTNGAESRTDGINFSSRPSSLSFDYKYNAVENEVGYAYIKILDTNGTVIAHGSVDLANQSTDKTVSVPLSNYTFGSKAAKLVVGFKSTKGEVHTVMPTDLDDIPGNDVQTNRTIPANEYKALSVGSVLTVSNVSLNY